APTQPSKQSSSLTIKLEPVELIFSTPPTSPHLFFDSLEDLPPWTTNPTLPQPSFDSIKRLENQPPPIPDVMEPPLPQQLLLMWSNDILPLLAHETFSFGTLLEDIHVTWTQFGKKQDKIAALHEVVSRICVQCLETASQFLAMTSEHTRDGVMNVVTTLEHNRLNGNPR
ncbi:hypothetical protein Tco_1522170, partial [Tanacetum coccineum]